MIQDIVTTSVDQEVLAKKRNAWANMGEAIYTGELALQARAQAKLIGITLPTKIDEVPQAESLLKELKGEMNSIQEERKKITSKLDEVTARLMLPEKSMQEPIKSLEAEIIKVKKADAEDRAKKQAKENELKECKEFLITTLANLDAQYKRMITEKVSKAYEYALGEGNIQLDGLDAFTQKAAAKFTEKDFTPVAPTRRLINVTNEEYSALVSEHFTVDANSYVLAYIVELEKKFSDYAVALNNKEHAIARAKQEEEAKIAAIAEEKANKEIAAQLEAASTDLNVSYGPVVKDLKEAYEVDMPETVESVIKIMAAFTANLSLCLPKLRVTKWMAFTATQAAGALAKVKNDDNAFSPSGITFKKVDKL